jgi:hypothetical protein
MYKELRVSDDGLRIYESVHEVDPLFGSCKHCKSPLNVQINEFRAVALICSNPGCSRRSSWYSFIYGGPIRLLELLAKAILEEV